MLQTCAAILVFLAVHAVFKISEMDDGAIVTLRQSQGLFHKLGRTAIATSPYALAVCDIDDADPFPSHYAARIVCAQVVQIIHQCIWMEVNYNHEDYIKKAMAMGLSRQDAEKNQKPTCDQLRKNVRKNISTMARDTIGHLRGPLELLKLSASTGLTTVLIQPNTVGLSTHTMEIYQRGSSSVMVFRYSEEWFSFLPVFISIPPTRADDSSRRFSTKDNEPSAGSPDAVDARVPLTVQVEPYDIVLVGSKGLFDNFPTFALTYAINLLAKKIALTNLSLGEELIPITALEGFLNTYRGILAVLAEEKAQKRFIRKAKEQAKQREADAAKQPTITLGNTVKQPNIIDIGVADDTNILGSSKKGTVSSKNSQTENEPADLNKSKDIKNASIESEDQEPPLRESHSKIIQVEDILPQESDEMVSQVKVEQTEEELRESKRIEAIFNRYDEETRNSFAGSPEFRILSQYVGQDAEASEDIGTGVKQMEILRRNRLRILAAESKETNEKPSMNERILSRADNRLREPQVLEDFVTGLFNSCRIETMFGAVEIPETAKTWNEEWGGTLVPECFKEVLRFNINIRALTVTKIATEFDQPAVADALAIFARNFAEESDGLITPGWIRKLFSQKSTDPIPEMRGSLDEVAVVATAVLPGETATPSSDSRFKVGATIPVRFDLAVNEMVSSLRADVVAFKNS